MAEKEVLYDLFKSKWSEGRKGTITQIDLQCKQWKLCPPDCEDCNCRSKEFKSAISRGIARIADFLPTRKKHNPMWPGGPPPQAKAAAPTQVKEEAKDEKELPTDPRRGAKKIRLIDEPKPKVKVKLSAEEKRIKAEAHAEELKAKLERRKEQFAEKWGTKAERQSGVENAKLRAGVEERDKPRHDDSELDPRSTTTSKRVLSPGPPKPPSGPPPKYLQPPPKKEVRRAIPAPPQIPEVCSRCLRRHARLDSGQRPGQKWDRCSE